MTAQGAKQLKPGIAPARQKVYRKGRTVLQGSMGRRNAPAFLFVYDGFEALLSGIARR